MKWYKVGFKFPQNVLSKIQDLEYYESRSATILAENKEVAIAKYIDSMQGWISKSEVKYVDVL